jgi:folate-dependent phosphoribosylglycinamide formyltransferase PurN
MKVLFIGVRYEACRAVLNTFDGTDYQVDILTIAGSRIATQAAQLKNHRRLFIVEKSRQICLSFLSNLLDTQEYKVIVSAGFPYILPKETLGRDILFLNSHPHILPDHKGYSVIKESFDQGVTEYGASFHYMAEAVDSGEMIVVQRISIQAKDISVIYDQVFSFLEPAVISIGLSRLFREKAL